MIQVFQVENAACSFLSATENNGPTLYIYEYQIPVVAESKFPGVTFDQKLSFTPHMKYLQAKCLKTLNLLKVLTHTNWGAGRSTLLYRYCSLIRSKLDYGSIVYGSARKSYLQMLDSMHHQGLSLASGAFRTSPVSSLYVRAGEPSLWLCRKTSLFSMPSDLLPIHFHHSFRNIKKET